MDRPIALPFRLGDWAVDPVLNRIARGDETVKLEPRMMRLLLCLAERAGEVVSADDLLDQAWPGVIVTPDSVYQGVAALRRVLGDDPKHPRYIVTVPRQGYRMIAAVSPQEQEPVRTDAPARIVEAASSATPRRVSWLRIGVSAIAIALAVFAFVAVRHRQIDETALPSATVAIPDAKSVAVLPFLDLTESMGEEVFADGMTEELIDKLSQIPGLHVPSPTASFWFKDKQLTVAQIAHSLGVAYVLDGSVRKSDTTMRIAARLVRASDGFVVWTETYDRPFDDRLMVQDDIAGEVRKAIEATIDRHAIATPGS
jgi:TolB-like protein/DNA-binding winged helix-turn-helix (wHTH) protein